MRKSVIVLLDRFRHERKVQIRFATILLVLALAVVGVVFWQLHNAGVAMTNDTYCGLEEHTHSEECYETVLACGLEEGEIIGHVHDESCLTVVQTLSCGLEETSGHTHSDSCYDENGNLICGQEESPAHFHTDACYEPQYIVSCGLEDSEPHEHDESCYEDVLICDIPEHEHDILCMSDENADVETASDWEVTLPDEISDNWAEAVIEIAQSQIGYTESVQNYQLSEDGETRQGYTRYGAWYGIPYGDWCAMFVSFCLNYAKVPESEFPEASGVYAWTVELQKMGLYASASDYEPVPGDIVFFDPEGIGQANHVGIVEEVTTKTVNGEEVVTKIKTIEGNSDDAVRENSYKLSDASILGYGVLPEQAEDDVPVSEYEAYLTAMQDIYEKALLLDNAEDAEALWNGLMDIWEQIYAALDDEDLMLTDEEQDNLNTITDAVYACVLLAGYDPYAVRTLADYTVEVTGSITITGATGNNSSWSFTSSNGNGSVSITESNNSATITGLAPGTVTVTHSYRSGNTTSTESWEVEVSSYIRVLVYVSAADVTDKMLELLGIDSSTIDVYGYFPAGVVYLDAYYLIDNDLIEAASTYDQALILTEDQWEELLDDLTGMVVTEDVFAEGYKANAGNKVGDYIKDAANHLGNGANSGATGLFHTGGYQGYSSEYSDVLFHLDVLFHTNTVTYIYGNNGISGTDYADGETAIDAETFIQGVTIQEANPNILIPDGYVFGGYYLDENLTQQWDGSAALTQDMTIYIALSEGVDVTVEKTDMDEDAYLDGAQFLLYKIVEEQAYNEDGDPITDNQGSPVTEEVTYYYDFNEFTGWVTNRSEATPYTTIYNEGAKDSEFVMTLADGTYYLEEVAAPDGYKLWSEPIEFYVTHTESDGINPATKNVEIISPDSQMVYVNENDNYAIIVKNIEDSCNVLKYTGDLDNEYTVLSGAEFVLSATATADMTNFTEGDTIYGVFTKTEASVDEGSEETPDPPVEEDEESNNTTDYYTFSSWTKNVSEATALVTGGDGYIHMTALPAGTYTLTETKAPDGYLVLDEAIVFTIDEKGSITLSDSGNTFASVQPDGSIAVKNDPGTELPNTGGIGTSWYTIGGLVLILGAGLCLKYKCTRRRKKVVS